MCKSSHVKFLWVSDVSQSDLLLHTAVFGDFTLCHFIDHKKANALRAGFVHFFPSFFHSHNDTIMPAPQQRLDAVKQHLTPEQERARAVE